MWNGSIGFGLVSIPVKLYSASEEGRLELDMLDSHDNERIRYKRVNKKTGKEVEWKDIVKGYKLDDEYIILDDEDFEQANAKKSKSIAIDDFVDKNDVADVVFKKPYYLEPQKEGGKAYNLLKEALIKTNKMGVATFVMRQKEHLCLIGVYEDALVLYLIRFAHEIRDSGELNLPDDKTTKKELDMAVSLIEQYSSKFDLTKYKDSYQNQLMEIIKAKAKGKKPKVIKFTEESTKGDELMAKLKESLKKKKNKVA
jgi:DNA end-binding protein Ku